MENVFWNRVALIYDGFVYIINRRVHKRLCEEVGKLISKDDDVLECACGTGMLTRVIGERCHHITATDLSRGMLNKTTYKCKDLRNAWFESADICELPYPNESFDKVVAANVIHLLDDPVKAIKELDRVCKKGGMLLIPTYLNKVGKEKDSLFSRTVDKAGADFKVQFDWFTYPLFFKELGYDDVDIIDIQGTVPCGLAVIIKN